MSEDIDREDYFANSGTGKNNPPVFTLRQLLPLSILSWKAFERLCTRLIEEEDNVREVHLYGRKGDDQKGVDIVAIKENEDSEEEWCYQCKNHEEFPKHKLIKVINDFEYEADSYVVCISTEASSDMRDLVNEKEDVQLWDKEDISRKLKNHQHLVADFFHNSWVDVFIPKGEDEVDEIPNDIDHLVRGTVFDEETGSPVEASTVKAICEGQEYKTISDEEGNFEIPLRTEVEEIYISVRKDTEMSSKYSVKRMEWDEIINNEIRILIEDEIEVSASIGDGERVEGTDDTRVMITIPGGHKRYTHVDPDGNFRIKVPSSNIYNLSFEGGSLLERTFAVTRETLRQTDRFRLARSCDNKDNETVYVKEICSGMSLKFRSIPSDTFRLGEDGEKEKEMPGFKILEIPVTQVQYSIFLQHSDYDALPEGWSNKFGRANSYQEPITGVSATDADAFCEWLTSITDDTYRVPNEDEWEAAARGTDGRQYPWGNSDTDIQERCNCIRTDEGKPVDVYNYSNGRSPYGLWGMAGNIWEWTNTDAEDTNEMRIVRGGSYYSTLEEVKCSSFDEFEATAKKNYIGFRIIFEEQNQI